MVLESYIDHPINFQVGLSQNASKGIVFGIVRDIDTNEYRICHRTMKLGSDNVVETDAYMDNIV